MYGVCIETIHVLSKSTMPLFLILFSMQLSGNIQKNICEKNKVSKKNRSAHVTIFLVFS